MNTFEVRIKVLVRNRIFHFLCHISVLSISSPVLIRYYGGRIVYWIKIKNNRRSWLYFLFVPTNWIVPTIKKYINVSLCNMWSQGKKIFLNVILFILGFRDKQKIPLINL